MAKAKGTSAAKPDGEKRKAAKTVFEMTPEELKTRAAAFRAAVKAAEKEHLPGLRRLDRKARQRSLGRYRGKESDALRAVLTAAQTEPTYFAALARRDHGKDDGRFEPGPSLAQLARRDALADASSSLDDVALALRDTVLALGHDPRAVALAVYGLAKPVYDAGDGSEAFRDALAPAVDYYARGATSDEADDAPTK